MNLNQEVESLITFTDFHPKDMTKEAWLEDFISLFNVLKDNYPYFYIKERMLGYNWLDLKENYIKRLEEAKEINDYLTVFYDAVVALQDSHTSIHLAHTLDYFFQDSGYAHDLIQKSAPFRRIFSDELKEASEYWKPFTKEFYSKRYEFDYDALILYSKGHYRIFDGIGSWEKKYGLGSIIKAVNGTPIDIAIKETFEKLYLYWDVKRKKPYQLYIDPHMFGREAKFTIETKDGETKEVIFETSNDYTYSQLFNYPSELLTTKIWPGNKFAYIRFANFEPEYYDEETIHYLKAFYEKVKDFEHLLIDVRGNGGGDPDFFVNNIIAPLAKKKLTSKRYVAYQNGSYVQLFRKDRGCDKKADRKKLTDCPPEVLTDNYTLYDATLIVEPTKEIAFKAKISVLADYFTFSAATDFVLFCKDSGFGKVYGMPNKGEGVASGPSFYVLPNSKILIRFFSSMGLDSQGNANEEMKVQPDVYYESELHNFDELLNFVLKDLKNKH